MTKQKINPQMLAYFSACRARSSKRNIVRFAPGRDGNKDVDFVGKLKTRI